MKKQQIQETANAYLNFAQSELERKLEYLVQNFKEIANEVERIVEDDDYKLEDRIEKIIQITYYVPVKTNLDITIKQLIEYKQAQMRIRTIKELESAE